MSILNLLGISDAFAADAATGATQGGAGGLMSMLPMLIIFFVVFYFLLIRPQTKRAKEHRKLMDNLTKGDEVVTSGGLTGRVVKIADDFIVVNISENVDITMQKAAIVNVLPKGTLKAVSST